ncbi:nucleolar complex protein 4 homolog isoform X1 [Scyliorhinus canicula]|uniref:nucleolar complex protein 4 homolog isoform X1 n=1 Tax=Scyliorhinus canicula TaxID=7830 RepID=UPI0018F787A9|nr:nucleolar complex protein 4 homolog isoform X1 [Scyliorhinus canicula]
MAAPGGGNTRSPERPQPEPEAPARAQARRLQLVLGSRRNANLVFDILEGLEADQEAEILAAARTCNKLFCTLLQRGDLFVGQLPDEEEGLSADCGAEMKYKIWMRHRYQSSIDQLLTLMVHESEPVQEVALCTLMKFVECEGRWPLVSCEEDERYIFPRELLKSLVDTLIQVERDASSLLSRFQEYLEYEDVRYYVMAFATEHIPGVMQSSKGDLLPIYQQNAFALLSSIHMPGEQSELANFLVKQQNKHDEWKAARLKEHRRIFERLWLAFLKHKLSNNLYKKVLMILHESILPHMSKPSLMIDFLTAAYEIGGAISLLALNGLFYLIHHHNLEYPDFYKKLYSLLDPSVLHVKYRARFFHLLDLFLSSSHLPAYLVAAFSKRLSRLALTSPPQALLMLIPFICNLIRRHPSCRPLIHRPSETQDISTDPYIMDEEDPTQCRAMESSLWELQTLQNHYHPDVASAASVINKTLSNQETDLARLLDLSVSELFEREPKKRAKSAPLEFEPAEGLLGRRNDLVTQHWTLD